MSDASWSSGVFRGGFGWSICRLARRRRPEPARTEAEVVLLERPLRRPGDAPPSPRDRLAHAYAASLLEVALQAETMLGGAVPALRPTRLDGVATAVVDALGADAARAGLRLYREATPAGLPEVETDAALAGLALKHLILRALLDEPAPGRLRVGLGFAGDAAWITLHRRAPSPARRRDYEAWALERMLTPLGATLESEAARGGYLPLSLVLPVAGPHPLRQAA